MSATQVQRNLASATPELMAFLRELTTPQVPSPAPRPQTIVSTPAAAEAGTWQERWIHDPRTTSSPPLAVLVLHPRVPAIKIIRDEERGQWVLPPVSPKLDPDTLVSVNSQVYKVEVDAPPITPVDVSLTTETWVSVEATESAWGMPIAEPVRHVLAALRESPVVPTWQTRYAVVPRSRLAKRVVLGPFTGRYEDWKFAEAAAKDMQEEGYVVEMVEDVETGDADALDFMGTNLPSTRRPIMRAGLAPK